MTTIVTKSADDNQHVGTSSKCKYRLEIDREACIGAASCVAIAGNTFALDEDNLVLIVEGDWDSEEMVLAAAQSCPVFAIKVFDNETGRQIFPEA